MAMKHRPLWSCIPYWRWWFFFQPAMFITAMFGKTCGTWYATHPVFLRHLPRLLATLVTIRSSSLTLRIEWYGHWAAGKLPRQCPARGDFWIFCWESPAGSGERGGKQIRSWMENEIWLYNHLGCNYIKPCHIGAGFLPSTVHWDPHFPSQQFKHWVCPSPTAENEDW